MLYNNIRTLEDLSSIVSISGINFLRALGGDRCFTLGLKRLIYAQIQDSYKGNDLSVPRQIKDYLHTTFAIDSNHHAPTTILTYLKGQIDAGLPQLRPTNTINDEEHRDLNQKYCGVYAIVGDDVVYVESIGRDGKARVYYKGTTVDRFDRSSTVDFKDIKYTIPKVGYVNTGMYSVLLERDNIRRNDKYKKGFHPDTVKLVSISDTEIRATGISYPTDPNIAPKESMINIISKDIFFREYPTYEQAFERVTSFQSLSSAFSSTLAIKLSKDYNKFVLMKNKWIIGTYDAKKGKWFLFNSLFNEDLDKHNINYEVV